jgi:hypothetical protein
MGVDLRGSRAWNQASQIIVPQLEKYQWFARQRSKGSLDDENCDGYLFDNAGMTESCWR